LKHQFEFSVLILKVF